MKIHPSPGRTPVAVLATLVTALLTAGCASADGVLPSNARLTNAESLDLGESLKRSEASSAEWPATQWWKRYADAQLDRLIAEALADNPSLRIAGARVRQTRALAGIADAARSPQITASAKSTRQRFSEHGTAPKSLAGSWDSYNEATLNFSYEFDFWGRNQAAFDASLDRVRASEVDAQAARLLLASGVVQTYFRLAHAFQQRDLAERILAQRQELLSLTRQRVGAGLDSDVSLTLFAGLQSIGLSQFVDAGSRVAGIGPAVSLPIFDGGRLRSNLGARNADYDAAVEQYNQTLVDALQDVVNQLTSMRWLAEQRREQALAVGSARRAHELAMQRYRAGLGTYLQVLIAESQVDSQKKLLIDLDARALQLDANLIRALGGGLLES